MDPLEEDEELDYDPTAYDCLHRLQLDWPCLRCGSLLCFSTPGVIPFACGVACKVFVNETITRHWRSSNMPYEVGSPFITHHRAHQTSKHQNIKHTSLVLVPMQTQHGNPYNQCWHTCCSCDIVKDELGAPRSTFPHCLTIVAGTQAPSAKQNYLAFLKLANLGQGRCGHHRILVMYLSMSLLECMEAGHTGGS